MVYLTPFFPSRSNHRYDASSFDAVDPLLGGDEALARLVDACHARGLRVMGDFTTNHTGAGHEWFRRAQADPGSDEHGFYLYEDGDYVSWLGVPVAAQAQLRQPRAAPTGVRRPDGVVRRWLGRRGRSGRLAGRRRPT